MRIELLYLILAAVSAGLAWLNHLKGKNSFALFLLIFTGVLLRIYMASDAYLHAWDERYHALVAKNMMENPFKPMLFKDPILGIHRFNWTTNHIWIHKQPLPLWSMAVSMKLFGVSEFAMRLPSLILSSAGIWFIYDLAKRMFSIQVGFFAGFLFAIQGLVLDVAAGRVATDHIDVFFLCLVLIAVWSAQRFSENDRLLLNVVCGMAIGAAILTKWLPALIVLPIWLLFQYKQYGFDVKKIAPRFLLLVIVVCAVALPWQLYIRSAFPLEHAWESSFNMRHITEVLDNMSGPFYYHFDVMRMVYGEIVYLPVLWFIYQTIKTKKITYVALLVWLMVPYLFFSFVQTKMQGYTLFAAPALLIICGLFWMWLKERLDEQRKRKWLVVLVMSLLIALPIRYSIERIKPLSDATESPQWVADLKRLNEVLPKNEKKILLNVHNYVECMFYADVTAYNYIPSNHIIDSLTTEGYTVYVNAFSEEIGDLSGVSYLHLTPSPY